MAGGIGVVRRRTFRDVRESLGTALIRENKQGIHIFALVLGFWKDIDLSLWSPDCNHLEHLGVFHNYHCHPCDEYK